MNDLIEFSLVIFLLDTVISIGMAFILACIDLFNEHRFPYFNYRLDLKKNL